jgi:hypothetical protein
VIDRDTWTLVSEAEDRETVVSRARRRLAREGRDFDVLDLDHDVLLEHVDARPRFYYRLYLRRDQPSDETETGA